MTDLQHNSMAFQTRRATLSLSPELRTIEASRSAFVPLDQPAQSFMADDLVEYDRLVFRRRITTRWRQELARRVGAVLVVATDEFTNEIIEMFLAADQEVVQTFLFQRLDDAFATGVEVRAADRQFDCLDVFRFKERVEFGGELSVAVVDQVRGLFVVVLKVHQKEAGLSFNPLSIRMQRCRRDVDFACLQVDEHEDGEVEETAAGEHLGVEKIASPECFGVDCKEFVPGAVGTPGRCIESFLFEDVADGLAADLVNAQSSQFAKDAGVAHASLSGNLEDQFTEDFPLARTARPVETVPTAFLTNPTTECAGGNDLDQPVDILAKWFAEFEQAGALGLGRMNLLGKPGAENRQFLGEILDMPSQPVLGGVGNEEQQRVKQPGHGVPASAGDNVLSDREIAFFLYPADRARTTQMCRKRLFENKETPGSCPKRHNDSLKVSLLSL